MQNPVLQKEKIWQKHYHLPKFPGVGPNQVDDASFIPGQVVQLQVHHLDHHGRQAVNEESVDTGDSVQFAISLFAHLPERREHNFDRQTAQAVQEKSVENVQIAGSRRNVGIGRISTGRSSGFRRNRRIFGQRFSHWRNGAVRSISIRGSSGRHDFSNRKKKTKKTAGTPSKN